MSTFETDARAVEIARLARDPAQLALLRAHVEGVIRGEAFAGSPRSQQFLRHVVGRSLEGDFESLKERVIGIELFNRSPSYDKAEDAIVRVTASDVRRRLSQHYQRHATDSECRINIPPGSYIPQITWIQQSGSPFIPDQAAPAPANTKDPTPPGLAEPKEIGTWYATWEFLFSLPLIFLLLGFSYWAGYRSHAPEMPRIIATTPPWTTILGTGHTLQIIASDPDFAAEQDITGHALSLSDYANERYIPEGSSLPPEIRSFCLRYLRGSRAADIDLPIVANIVSLAKPVGQKVQIRGARLIHPADFHTDDDFILLGSPIANPWVDLFASQLDFKFVFTTGSSLEEIANVRPKRNEMELYTPIGKFFEEKPPTGTSFAIVAFLQNPHQSGHVLILAGTGAEGTAAAAQVITNISNLSKVLQSCAGPSNQPLQSFELLLKLSVMGGSATNTEVVACHRLPSQ
jgi:hypothetical protein